LPFFKLTSLVYYTQHTMQYDTRQQTHVHTIIQVVCCWVQTEKWKKESENKHF